ncbi:MAG: DUF5107 domain-containing protein [Candidatus Zipacnadales bacterium]
MSRIYPYPMQDDLTEEVRDVSYRALHIENDYLHCIVLPQLGGRLYSLYDKLSKREVFYRNNVVKYGLIARRGAWISGGIEFNFPQGHSCVTVSPVASHLEQNSLSDTVSITVGTIDLVSRMRWSVKLSLTDGEARLRQEVMLHNPTPLRQRHYFWANSAVPARDDLRLVYPATKCRTLGGEHPYPIQDGRDMSLYRNHKRPNDIFALDVTEDFFGCYYEDLDVGLIHWSDHRFNCGKKFFTWGTADEGMIWVDLLTDEDGQYVELQSGRFIDQQTFEFLAPYQCVKWTEFWYPLHGTGGFCYGDGLAALNLKLDGQHVQMAVFPTVSIGDADLVIDVDGHEVWQSAHVLEPGCPVREEVSLPFSPDENSIVGLSLEVEGQALIRYEHPPAYLPNRTSRPPELSNGSTRAGLSPEKLAGAKKQLPLRNTPASVELPKQTLRAPDDPCVTAEELTCHAVKAEKLDNWERAAELYGRALDKDPGFAAAHLGLGILRLRQGLTEEAVEAFRNAISRDPDCDEAWYYLALAYERSGELATAQAIWARLVGRSKCRTEAVINLTKMLDPPSARELLSDLPDSPTSRFLWVHSHRVEGLWDAATMASFQKQDPLAPELAAEAYFQALCESPVEEADKAWERLCNLLLDDAELWLELAALYQRYGLLNEAWRLIARAASEIPAVRQSPIVFYFLAWWGTLGQEVDLERLREQLTPDYCFPSRTEEEMLLLTACEANAQDWKVRLCLGNLFASLGRRNEALAIWNEAAILDDSDAILCRNLGLAYHLWKHDHSTALAWYDKAVERRPEEYRLYLERDRVLMASGVSPQQRLTALESAPDRWEIAARRIECLVDLERWDEALALLRGYRFCPWEGARQMHVLWTRALCGQAELRTQLGDLRGALSDYQFALTYPRNLGVGRAAYPEEAKICWLAAECARRLSEEATQHVLLESAASERHLGVCEADLYTLKALQALGRHEEALSLRAKLQEWAEQHPDHPLAAQIKQS